MNSPKHEPRPDLADFHRQVPMDDMIEVVGVGVLAAVDVDGGGSYLRARAACHDCSCQHFCRDWLAEHSQEQQPQAFCPNANFFRAVKTGGG